MIGATIEIHKKVNNDELLTLVGKCIVNRSELKQNNAESKDSLKWKVESIVTDGDVKDIGHYNVIKIKNSKEAKEIKFNLLFFRENEVFDCGY